MNIIRLLGVGMILLTSVACDRSDLSRDKAADLIEQHPDIMQRLTSIQLNSKGRDAGMVLGYWTKEGSLTAKGQKYLPSMENIEGQRLPYAIVRKPLDIEITVTGIADEVGDNIKRVEFQWEYRNASDPIKHFIIQGGTGWVFMQLYDDGWRIDKGLRLQPDRAGFELSASQQAAFMREIEEAREKERQKERERMLVFEGHKRSVNSVAFSPDGKYALSGNGDKTLHLWDVASGKPLRVFEGHKESVNSVAFSPDGKHALSGSYDRTLRLWDVASGQTLQVFEGHNKNVFSVAFSPDGKHALSGGDKLALLGDDHEKILRLWDVASGKTLRVFKEHGRGWTGSVNSVAFSPNGKYALSGGGDTTLRLWDVASGQMLRVFKGHERIWWGKVNSVTFSPDGKYALSGSGDKTLRLWDVASGQTLRIFEGHTHYVNSVAFSPDGKYALSGSDDRTLRLWDVASGKPLRVFEGHKGSVNSVAFNPDGKYALSGSDDGTLRRWKVSLDLDHK